MTAHPPSRYDAAAIARARERVRTSPAARGLAEETLALAERWAAFDDARLEATVPPPEVPRAFNTSFEGCPIHGRALFAHGNYSWRFDPFSAPWTLVCPVGGERYPSNDFAAYLAGGMVDRTLLRGPYADDGWGWQPPGGGHRHWFVAYYCHWFWLQHLIPATLALARAHLLTGEARFAHKAGVLLARIARDYPRMDHNRQSRYATEFVPTYTGKIVNLIWETDLVRDLAEAWDAVALAVAADPALGPGVVDLVEGNLLREALAAIAGQRIRGNYGMHQLAALNLALALGDRAVAARTVDHVLHGWPEVESYLYEGLVSVLANLFGSEGLSYETAPGYCAIPSNLLPQLLEPLDRLQALAGRPPDAAVPALLPRLAALVRWPERLECLEQWTPAIGDSGSAGPPGVVDVSLAAYRAVHERAPSAWSAARLAALGATDEECYQRFADLFAPSPSLLAARSPRPLATSDVLTDYGLAILRTGSGGQAVALTIHYGRANAGHAHADRLNIECHGAGRKLVPDLGYPQFAAEDKTARVWDRNSGSHALVVVDGQRQPSHNGGRLLLFARSAWLQGAAADSPAYPQCDRYERTLLVIGEGEVTTPYVVDLFRVRGGARHDYRLHGPGLPDHVAGASVGPILPGTLAGPDVTVGALWDDPELDQPDRSRPFASYAGCGDSFLWGVQQAQLSAETWRVTWGDDDGGLSVHVPPQALASAYLAWGDVPKRPGNPERLRHLILRREGEPPLSSAFATVLEPLTGAPTIRQVERLAVASQSGALALRISHAGGSDLILAGESGLPLNVEGVTLDGRLAVLRADAAGRVRAAFLHGRLLQSAEVTLTTPGALAGVIVALDADGHRMDLRLAGATAEIDARHLAGAIITVAGSRQQALIEEAAWVEPPTIRLTLDRPATIGALLVERSSGATLTTRTTLYPPFEGRDDLGAHLEGAWLQVEQRAWRIQAVRLRPPQGHALTLEPGAGPAPVAGARAELVAWRVGVDIQLEPMAWWAAAPAVTSAG